MKFSLNLPIAQIEPPGEFNTGEAVRELAIAIEDCGADACWVIDHPAPYVGWLEHRRGHDAVDPFIALTYAAAATKTLRLQTNVLVLPYRNPFLTAKAVTTLEWLSGSRLILGVGSGYMEGEFAALGIDFKRRGALMDEALETMAMVWSGEPVVRKGMDFNAPGNQPRPTPPRQPTIWIGGAADNVLKRVVKWGAGWTPFFAPKGDDYRDAQHPLTTIPELKARIDYLGELMDEAGRTDPIDICINLPTVPKDRSRSETERCLETIAALKEVGVSYVFHQPHEATRAAYLDTLQWFGENVIAKARK